MKKSITIGMVTVGLLLILSAFVSPGHAAAKKKYYPAVDDLNDIPLGI